MDATISVRLFGQQMLANLEVALYQSSVKHFVSFILENPIELDPNAADKSDLITLEAVWKQERLLRKFVPRNEIERNKTITD